MSYDNSKQVIMRKVVADNPTPTTPVLSVEWTDKQGVKQTAALWEWTRKDGSPVLDKHGNKMYQGNYKEDTYAQEQGDKGMEQARAAAAPAVSFEDDDIPF
jgi:hypothetical protein